MQKTDSDLLKVRSFGKTSLREVKRRLADMGLSLGMDLDALAAGQLPSFSSDDLDLDDEDDGEDVEDTDDTDGSEETETSEAEQA